MGDRLCSSEARGRLGSNHGDRQDVNRRVECARAVGLLVGTVRCCRSTAKGSIHARTEAAVAGIRALSGPTRREGPRLDLAATLLVCLETYPLGAVSFCRLALQLVGEGPATADDALDVPITGTDATLQYTSVGATSVGMHHGGGLGCAIGLLVALIVSQAGARLLAHRSTGLHILDAIHDE